MSTRRRPAPYLGWAYLPGLSDSQLYLDGIVSDWAAMPGTSDQYAGAYDLGLTLVHEAGHWVNLEHTFFGGCNAKGDFVDDTPAMKVPTSGCPRARTRAPSPGSTRSTTTWTTRTTPVTTSSPRGRSPARRTPGSTTGRRSGLDGGRSGGPR